MVKKAAEAIVSPHHTISKQRSATSQQESDDRGEHASAVQDPAGTTNMRRLPSVRKLLTNNRISRRTHLNTPVQRRPGAMSIKGLAPGSSPEWIQRLANDNRPKRSSTHRERTSAIICEAFAISQRKVSSENFHVLRSSQTTVKRAPGKVPMDDQSHLPPEMRTTPSNDQSHLLPPEMRTISSNDQSHLPPEMRTVSSATELDLWGPIEEEETCSILDDEDIGVGKFRANIVPNRRISKMMAADVALVSGELAQVVINSPVVSIRDSENFEGDDSSETRSRKVNFFRFLGFKKKKKRGLQPSDANIMDGRR